MGLCLCGSLLSRSIDGLEGFSLCLCLSLSSLGSSGASLCSSLDSLLSLLFSARFCHKKVICLKMKHIQLFN